MVKYSPEFKQQIVNEYLEGLNSNQFLIVCWNTKKESAISVAITIIEFILR